MQTLKIKHDELSESPREWDNLGTMVCFHRRYTLGDKHDFSTPDDFQDTVTHRNAVILPLYLYDHGGITIRTAPFSCPWDSGQVGWIYVSKEKIREEYSCKQITKDVIEKVEKVLEAEVKTYDQFLTGDVYGFVIEDEDGQDVDSCWGFYGYDWETNGIKDYIPAELHNQLEDIEVTA